jgi:hypothetical protein
LAIRRASCNHDQRRQPGAAFATRFSGNGQLGKGVKIACFLKAEITFERFGQQILMQLKHDNKEISIVNAPDLSSEADNAYRRHLLASYRAYVFDDLPRHTAWYCAALGRDEVTKIRYIDYSYWNELSDNTRLPSVAAKAIRAGREFYGQSKQGFLAVAETLRAGAQFPELIVVGASLDAALTVFEGHVRLTAYLLAPECIPTELEVIAGFVPECALIEGV